jgi:hypothetical protein
VFSNVLFFVWGGAVEGLFFCAIYYLDCSLPKTIPMARPGQLLRFIA